MSGFFIGCMVFVIGVLSGLGIEFVCDLVRWGVVVVLVVCSEVLM